MTLWKDQSRISTGYIEENTRVMSQLCYVVNHELTTNSGRDSFMIHITVFSSPSFEDLRGLLLRAWHLLEKTSWVKEL